MTTDLSEAWNPLVALDDPYPVYRRLRDEAPVFHHERAGLWALSRFDDVQTAAKDWETFSTSSGGRGNDIDDTYQLFLPAGDLAGVDPPLHTRLRGALRLAFSPSSLRARFEPIVRRKVLELIDAFADAGHADFARDLARPLPGTTMFSWFGFPEADHPELLSWFGEMLERDAGVSELPARALAGRDRMRAYMQDAAAERRRAPREDLMSFLVAANDAGEISADELLGASMLLFVAGITTTSGLISNSLLHLDRFPDQRDRIRDEPVVIPGAIEELLRFDAPIQALARTATRDVLLHDAVIPAGARVALVWASANRDERRWPDPDRLDIARPVQRHVSFGDGIHHCLGAPLARLEASIVFEELFRRIPEYAVTGPIVRIKTPTDRALESLPVEF
ncbi:MAG TPA: cytochrome P450 [Candidatus Limnocylindrales bacterium]